MAEKYETSEKNCKKHPFQSARPAEGGIWCGGEGICQQMKWIKVVLSEVTGLARGDANIPPSNFDHILSISMS